MTKQKQSFNSLVVGIIPGLIVPLITVYLFYLTNDVYGVQSFSGFINYVIKYGVISQVLSVCLLGNLAIFFLFIWTNRYKSARGVIGATFLYALVIIILKLI